MHVIFFASGEKVGLPCVLAVSGFPKWPPFVNAPSIPPPQKYFAPSLRLCASAVKKNSEVKK
jgi:hypothetical protein